MRIENKYDLKKKTILLENKHIRHCQSIKNIGTHMNENLERLTHIYNNQNTLMKQLKSRLKVIKYAKTFISKNFLLMYYNVI